MNAADRSHPPMIRVALPLHLRTLARLADPEVTVTVAGPVTQRTLLDALENRYPMLCGTVRQHDSLERRPRVRFFAGTEDVTHQPPDTPLSAAVAAGREPFRIVGAIAGG